MMRRPRLSRIFYDGKFFDYPLNAGNALRNLGADRVAALPRSYVWAHLKPRREEDTFEAWVSSRFGRRLYRMFFKTYTEKVWGMPGRRDAGRLGGAADQEPVARRRRAQRRRLRGERPGRRR